MMQIDPDNGKVYFITAEELDKESGTITADFPTAVFDHTEEDTAESDTFRLEFGRLHSSLPAIPGADLWLSGGENE